MNEQINEGDLTIRAIERSDIEQLAQLEKECFSDPWSEQMLSETLENPICVNLAIKKGEQIIAFAFAYHIMTEMQIMQFAVAPLHRRKGLADKMLEKMVEYAGDNEVESFYLEVRKSNKAAQKLYAKHNFKQTAVRKRYYDSPAEDAVIMELVL